jgi:hypothetical protein
MTEKDNPKEKTLEEHKRDIALRNLKAANLMNVAAAYIVHKSGQYGTAGDNAMNEYKYFPSFNSGLKAYDANGKEYDIFKESILNSREDGQLYSGNVSELRIMKDCVAIMQESLGSLTVNDVMGLMGSKANINDKYNGKYLENLMPKYTKEELSKLSEDKKKELSETMGLYQNLIGGYSTYLANIKVSEALTESAKEIPKGLEKILAEPEKKEGAKK